MGNVLNWTEWDKRKRLDAKLLKVVNVVHHIGSYNPDTQIIEIVTIEI